MDSIRFIIYNYGLLIFIAIITVLLIFTGTRSKINILKYICYNLSAIFIALFIYEIYPLFTKEDANINVKFSGTYTDNIHLSGPKKNVGYGPESDTSFQVTASRKNGDTTVYNVIYTIENGIRKTPGVCDTMQNFVYFLGCSHVFGDGLNDYQTLPFFFNFFTQGKYNVKNLAFSGYGPHQALRIVEENILTAGNIPDSSSATVIFSFTPSHFLRAAGMADWDKRGPWYEVENKMLVLKGTFEDLHPVTENYILKRLKIIWQNSHLYKSFFVKKISEKDVIRVIEILKSMRAKLGTKKIKFYVLCSARNDADPLQVLFYEKLKSSGINYFFIEEIIPDFRKNIDLYFIRGDGHPNENYNKKVAEFLSKKIL